MLVGTVTLLTSVVWAQAARALILQSDTADGKQIKLEVLPGRMGLNQLRIWVRDRHGQRVKGPVPQVTMTLPALKDMPGLPVGLRPGKHADFIGMARFDMPGAWVITLDGNAPGQITPAWNVPLSFRIAPHSAR